MFAVLTAPRIFFQLLPICFLAHALSTLGSVNSETHSYSCFNKQGVQGGRRIAIISLPESLSSREEENITFIFGHFYTSEARPSFSSVQLLSRVWLCDPMTKFRYQQRKDNIWEEHRTPVAYFTTKSCFGFLLVPRCCFDLLSPRMRFKIVSIKMDWPIRNYHFLKYGDV